MTISIFLGIWFGCGLLAGVLWIATSAWSDRKITVNDLAQAVACICFGCASLCLQVFAAVYVWLDINKGRTLWEARKNERN